MTPAQLVRKIRMERASQLLQAHAANVSDVARAVGYRDPSHFSRVFMRVYGERPREWEGEHL
jgi:AraC-like DNA-binding protein